MQWELTKASLIPLFIFCSSCAGQRDFPADPADYFDSVSVVEVVPVANLDDYGIFMPVGIASWDGRFFVQTTQKGLLIELDRADSAARTILLRGNGPGEILAPTYLTTSGRTAMLVDCNRKTIAEIDMSGGDIDVVFTEIRTESSPLLSVISSGDNLIFTGLFDKGRYLCYDRAGGNERFYGEYRLGKEYDDMDNSSRCQVYINTKLGIRPDLSRFAAINFNCGVVDINEIRNDSIIQVRGVDFHYPEISGRRGQILQSMDNRNGFIDIAASDKYIYAIYSGKTYRDEGPDFSLCDCMMVFDWEGSPVMYYKLPVPISTICYDAVRCELHGVSPGETTMLYKIEVI